MKSAETDCSLVVVQEVVGSIPISHPIFLSSYGARGARQALARAPDITPSNGPLAAIFSPDYGESSINSIRAAVKI